jgi:hypothetical protein
VDKRFVACYLHLDVHASYFRSKTNCDEIDCWCWVVNKSIVNTEGRKKKHIKRCKELETAIRVKSCERVVDSPTSMAKT